MQSFDIPGGARFKSSSAVERKVFGCVMCYKILNIGLCRFLKYGFKFNFNSFWLAEYASL